MVTIVLNTIVCYILYVYTTVFNVFNAIKAQTVEKHSCKCLSSDARLALKTSHVGCMKTNCVNVSQFGHVEPDGLI